MAQDNIFPDGIMYKEPKQGAPDFIKGGISIKSDKAIEWIKAQLSEWINLDIKVSKAGKPYLSLNDWKPNCAGGRGNQQQSNASMPENDTVNFDPAQVNPSDVPF